MIKTIPNSWYIYRIFSIKRRVNRAAFKINTPAFIRGPGVYLRSGRLFAILNHDCVVTVYYFSFYHFI